MAFFDEEKNLVLLDLNNTLFRALAVNKELMHKGNMTGGLYGFTVMLSSIINFASPKNIIVCDDKKPYFRQDIYAKYKKDRVTKDDAEGFFETYKFNKDLVLELLSLMYIPVYQQQGYEADDWIAYFAGRFNEKFDKTIIVSNDSDLLSLMKHKNVFIYKSANKKAKTKAHLYGRKHFDEDYYPVTPETFDLYTAMVGSHNGFPGISKIGEVTAKKILSDPQKLKEIKNLHSEHFIEAFKVLTLPYEGMSLDKPDKEILLKHKTQQVAVNRLLAKQGINVSNLMDQAFNFYR